MPRREQSFPSTAFPVNVIVSATSRVQRLPVLLPPLNCTLCFGMWMKMRRRAFRLERNSRLPPGPPSGQRAVAAEALLVVHALAGRDQLAPLLRHAYITHRYGVSNRKPSAHVFELMMRRERCQPADIVYVGDDPSKDFVGLRPLGVRTLRVRTGRHAGVVVPAAEDAERTLPSIAEVPAAVARFESEAQRVTAG